MVVDGGGGVMEAAEAYSRLAAAAVVGAEDVVFFSLFEEREIQSADKF